MESDPFFLGSRDLTIPGAPASREVEALTEDAAAAPRRSVPHAGERLETSAVSFFASPSVEPPCIAFLVPAS